MPLSIIPFNEFEKTVMLKMFEKRNAINELLLSQYQQSTLFKREFIDERFISYLIVPEDAQRVPAFEEYGYGDVVASINGSDFDYGFVLHIENGLIEYLEGYTHAGTWPETIHSFELKHLDEIAK